MKADVYVCTRRWKAASRRAAEGAVVAFGFVIASLETLHGCQFVAVLETLHECQLLLCWRHCMIASLLLCSIHCVNASLLLCSVIA